MYHDVNTLRAMQNSASPCIRRIALDGLPGPNRADEHETARRGTLDQDRRQLFQDAPPPPFNPMTWQLTPSFWGFRVSLTPRRGSGMHPE